MNIKINNDESFKEERISVINSFSEKVSVTEDTVLSENENQVDDSSDEGRENHCEDKKSYSLNEHLMSDLIDSMNRLREYDLQKYQKYYIYLKEDEDIISDLTCTYYE